MEDLRQQVYSKKQKPGEYTLSFIDQFVSLVNRLPEPVSREQCVYYILKGIRVEVARMARTDDIRNVDELITYVKLNYGQNEHLEPRSVEKQFTNRPPHMNNRVSQQRVEQIDYEDELPDQNSDERDGQIDYEVNEFPKHSKSKMVKEVDVPEDTGRPQSMGTVNDPAPLSINVIQSPSHNHIQNN